MTYVAVEMQCHHMTYVAVEMRCHHMTYVTVGLPLATYVIR